LSDGPRKRRRRSGKKKAKQQDFSISRLDRPELDTRLAVGVFPVFGKVETNALDVLPIFRPDDFRIISKSDNRRYWLWEDYWIWGLDEPLVHYPTFQVSVGNAIERLEAQGISLISAERQFEQDQAQAVAEMRRSIERTGGNAHTLEGNSPYKVMKNMSFKAWKSSFSLLVTKGVWKTTHLTNVPRAERKLCSTLIRDDVNPFGYPCEDQRYFLRAALEEIPREEVLILHCFIPWDTDGAALYSKIEEQLIGDSSRFDKTIILIEGRTDSEILNRALKVLRPHLSQMFHFLQFQEYGLDGGASNLVNTVKAFAASGIRNRVIALFDNDTAGHEAAQNLIKEKRNREKLPANFKIMTLPDIEEARHYPTIGPTGEEFMDVNGKAAAIELYFPLEARLLDGRNPDPVQWTGYNKVMKRYNGSLVHKEQCQKRMLEILDYLEKGERGIWETEFEGLDAVFDALVKAYH